MNRWKMRGVAALAVITLAVAGCQNEGAGESLDALPSIDTGVPTESMDMGSMDMGSPSAEPSESAAP
ncbi:MAG: hypothetical protein M3Y40_03225 [Chloroflexota bacterium]|nr:hypothetical protein [Chloroflexota bacterium]